MINNGNEEKGSGPARREDRRWLSFKFFIIGLLSGVFIFVAISSALPFIMMGLENLPVGPGSVSHIPAQYENPQMIQAKINRIYKVLDEFYVNDYDKRETVENLYAGIVSGVGDPYTVYFDSDKYTRFKEDTSGTYAGIGLGVNIDKDANAIVVVAPFDGTPAATAGIKSGDFIVKINGTEVNGEMLDLAVSMMKGEPDTNVSLTIFRPSESKNYDFVITRKNINVPTVSSAMLENNIAYMRITQFDRVTSEQFTEAYNELKPTMKGLILDLRNNPGGLLNVVTEITDMLVPEGVIVYQENKHGDKQYNYSKVDKIDVPLLILVNGGSASASEVLSGAVQDTSVGQLVGTQTFGKGVVQNIIELGDGSAVKVTIAKYYTPSGRCIQDIGLTPDYPVEMSDGQMAKVVDGQIELETDNQLMEAIKIMTKKIK